MRIDAAIEARIALVADMTEPHAIERLPDRRQCDIDGVSISWLALAPFEASAPAKLRFALMAALDPGRLTP
jgi:hypothetical protein